MNSPANRSSQLPPTAREELPLPPSPLVPAQPAEPEAAASAPRQVPIPPPSNPKQYRAIGLIEGKFQHSEEKITQGVLLTGAGIAIDTVLLGRVMSLVKKHLDLEQPHLWVVYPRTRQENDELHVQIAGVWEPESLHRQETSPTEPPEPAPALVSPKDGYFSIRGEVVYYSEEKGVVIVKIRQSPKKEGERPKFFKLKLKGILPGRPLRHFWDLQVQLQGAVLTIEEGTDLGPAFKKQPFKKGSKKPIRKKPGQPPSNRLTPPGERPSLGRPVKKREQST